MQRTNQHKRFTKYRIPTCLVEFPASCFPCNGYFLFVACIAFVDLSTDACAFERRSYAIQSLAAIRRTPDAHGGALTKTEWPGARQRGRTGSAGNYKSWSRVSSSRQRSLHSTLGCVPINAGSAQFCARVITRQATSTYAGMRKIVQPRHPLGGGAVALYFVNLLLYGRLVEAEWRSG